MTAVVEHGAPAGASQSPAASEAPRSHAKTAAVVTALPVFLLGEAAVPDLACAGTVDSIARQSVVAAIVPEHLGLEDVVGEYVIFVFAGVQLDVTACERAIWFLATHQSVDCVTGAIQSLESASPVSSAIQFVVARRAAAVQVLSAGRERSASLAVALVIGLRRATGRGGGWLGEPVISSSAPDDALQRVHGDAHAALLELQLDAATLIDKKANDLSLMPLQRLMPADAPSVTHRPAPATGRRVLAMLQGFPMGGYTAFNVDLLPRLAAAGHSVTTCTTEYWRSDWRLDRVRSAAPDIHHVHDIVPQAATLSYIDWLITSREIEVVLLSHSLLGYHLLPCLRARHPTVAFVDYVHTDWFEAGMYGSYATMAARWNGQLDAQLATSDALVAQLVADGCEADAVRTAYIGVDTEAWHHQGPRFAAVRESIGAGEDTLILLFSGRLSPEKRPQFAVDVTAQLLAEGHDVLLLLAGGGPLIQQVHAQAAVQGIGERCKLLGEVEESTLRFIYAASDIFLAPSEIEGVARSLYEAMAMGCVPVVSDVGGQRELVTPGTGSLVAADCTTADRYTAAVRPWLDRAARTRASASARARMVAYFDSRLTVATVSDAFERAMIRRRNRQDVLLAAMAEELAVMSLEIMRRHVLRHAGH